jgi:hypothetical protein
VVRSVQYGNKKAAFCGGFVVPDKPSDGLEPSTPSLPWNLGGNRVATHSNALRLSELFQRLRFAGGCDRLRPLCSINAPYSRPVACRNSVSCGGAFVHVDEAAE